MSANAELCAWRGRHGADRRDDRRRVRPDRRPLRRLPRADRANAGHPLDLSRAGRTGRCVRRGAAGARFRARRAGRDLGAELRRMGRDAIRDREGRADPGQYQPGLSPCRARIRAEQGRRCRHRHRDRVQDQRLCRHAERAGAGTGERGAGAAPGREAAASAQRDPDRRPAAPGMFAFDDVAAMGGDRERARLAELAEHAAIRRPDQHPVHLGHDRGAEGRDADAPQHPQ